MRKPRLRLLVVANLVQALQRIRDYQLPRRSLRRAAIDQVMWRRSHRTVTAADRVEAARRMGLTDNDLERCGRRELTDRLADLMGEGLRFGNDDITLRGRDNYEVDIEG